MGEAGGSQWVMRGAGGSPLGSTASSAYPLPRLPQVFLLPRCGSLPPLRWQPQGPTRQPRPPQEGKWQGQSGCAEWLRCNQFGEALAEPFSRHHQTSANPIFFFFFKETAA